MAAVVVLTGVADTDVAHEALRLGAQDWLMKDDVDPELLWRSVRYAVERKRLVDDRLRAQKLEIAGRLATGVAHEFNNVLTAIVGSAHLVEAAADDVEKRAASALLHRAARQGAALSRQLLSLARNPTNHAAIVSATVLVETALPLVHAILPNEIKLSVGPVPDAEVEIDPGQFDQVILNLVFNAKDAMPHGGILRITVDVQTIAAAAPGATDDRSYVVFQVSDTGSGIDPDTVPHIFEPFFTTKGWRGTGLGLAVCAEIAERFGGTIHAESRPGAGTTIALRLPAARPSARPH